jgi:hypothetical protein
MLTLTELLFSLLFSVVSVSDHLLDQEKLENLFRGLQND